MIQRSAAVIVVGLVLSAACAEIPTGPAPSLDLNGCTMRESYTGIATTPSLPGFSTTGTLDLIWGQPLFFGGVDIRGFATNEVSTGQVSGVNNDGVYTLNFTLETAAKNPIVSTMTFQQGASPAAVLVAYYPASGLTVVWNVALTRTAYGIRNCPTNGVRG